MIIVIKNIMIIIYFFDPTSIQCDTNEVVIYIKSKIRMK